MCILEIIIALKKWIDSLVRQLLFLQVFIWNFYELKFH